jgi:hypothetical protein
MTLLAVVSITETVELPSFATYAKRPLVLKAIPSGVTATGIALSTALVNLLITATEFVNVLVT